jgi:conjugal transfer pilin signal peptidase TrbI
MKASKHRKPWGPFLLKALLITLVFVLFYSWVDSRFRIGVDGQAIRCLPDHKYYLVDMAEKTVNRDEIMAYASEGLMPYYQDGTMMAKFVRGVPGDKVVIDKSGVTVNGTLVAEGFSLSQRLGEEEEFFYREFMIPKNKYLMLAPAPESYDGRYWGLIDKSQIMGNVTPLL